MGATVIKHSRRKLALLLISPCAFLACGYWLAAYAHVVANFLGLPSAFVRGLGLAAFIVGLVAAFGIFRMLFNSAPGLVLDNRGVTDNSTIFPAGFVPWSNISGFEAARKGRVAIIYVLLKDAKQYIASRGPFMRVVLAAASRLYASPVAIRPGTLHVQLQELVPLMNKYLSTQGQDA